MVDSNEFTWWAQDDKYILDFKNKKIIQDLYEYNASNVGGFMLTKNADAETAYTNLKKYEC